MKRTVSRSGSAAAEMLGCTLLWGAFFVVGKASVGEARPLVVATLRFAVASVSLLALLVWREPQALRIGWRDGLLAAALGLTGVALYNGLAFYGFAYAPGSDGAMISPSLNPVITVLVAAFAFSEPLTRARLFGLLLALAGIALVFGGPSLASAATPERLFGDVLFVLSAVSWSAYTLLGKLAVRRFSPLASTTYAAVAGLAMLLPFAASDLARVRWGELSAGFWGAVAFLAWGSTVAAFLLWYHALGKVGAARTASYLPLVPIFGVALGVIALGDRPTSVQLAGMAIAVAGVYAANRP